MYTTQFATLLLIFCISLPVRAENDLTLAKDHFKRGSSAFDLGNYDEAITEYGAAYRLKSDPVLLYNMAQAHRLAGHAAEALRFYKVYLLKRPGAQNRDEVQAKVVELERLVQESKRAQQLAPQTTKQSEPAEQVERANEPSPTAQTITGRPTPPSLGVVPPSATAQAMDEQPRRTNKKSWVSPVGLKIAGVSVAIVAVALVAVGGGIFGLAKDADTRYLHPANGVYSSSAESDRATYNVLDKTFLITGGVALAAGATLVAVGVAKSGGWSLAPTVSTDRASIALNLRF